MFRFISFWAVWSLSLLSFASLPAADKPLETGAREQVQVMSVQIPVYVTRKGEPVRNLTVDNFLVSDNGKRQEILGLDIQDLTRPDPGRTDEEHPLPAAARRNFLFLFDLSYSSSASLIRARTAASKILEQAVRPEDRVGVAVYGIGMGVRLVLNFTSDRQQLELAIASIYAPIQSGGFVDPLGLTILAPNEVSPALNRAREAEIAQDDGRGGRGGALDREDEVQQQNELLERMAKNNEDAGRRQQVSNLAKDLSELASLLDSVVGRKQIIYLSEGFSDDLMLATQDRKEIARMNEAATHGQHYDIDTSTRFGDNTVRSNLSGMLDRFLKSDCVIHSINIANSADNPRGGGKQGLFMMASDTGGTYTDNINKLDTAIGKVFRMTGLTYVLSFQPSDLEQDGAYHKLKVKLKNAPKGAKIRYRPGYFAPLPFDKQTKKQRTVRLANRILADVEGGSIRTRGAAFPFVGPDGRGLVPFLLEIDGSSLTRGYLEPTLPVQLFAYALDQEGRIHDLLSQLVRIDVQKAGDVFREHGLKYYGAFSLDPGDYDLRVLILNPKTGATTLNILPVSVPAADGREGDLLPPMVPDPFGSWLLAREEPSPDEPPAPFPFMAGDRPYLPSAAPDLRRGKPAQLVLMGRLPGPEIAGLQWTILDPDGKTIDTRAVRDASSVSSSMDGYRVFTADFDPKPLPAGDYRLRWSVTLPDGSREESPEAAITVR